MNENTGTSPKPLAPRRNSIEYLVTYGLSYCCLWAFLTRFKDTATEVIATRLGCGKSTVRKARADKEKGCIGCTHSKECVLNR